MRRMLIAAVLYWPLLSSAYSTGTTLGGTVTVVNDGAGNQSDPHVSGDFAAYTHSANGSTQIRYYQFASGTDSAIPNTTASGTSTIDFLSDVSGQMIVFTRIGSGRQSIWSFDIATAGPAVELDPQSTSNRRGAAIGNRTVAWQDFGFSSGGLQTSEIVVYDLDAASTVRVTQDSSLDRSPAVSADGTVIAWEKCATTIAPCDIWLAVRGASGWSASQVTSTADPEAFPDTNGSIVVYGAVRAGNASGADIYWRPVSGGAESQLSLPGEQRNPNISGSLIAFESRNFADATPNFDIYLYDLANTTLYRLTNTPFLDETLNDVTIAGGNVRVIWSVLEQDLNVYAYTFGLSGGGGGGGGGSCSSTPSDCSNPGGRPLLATLALVRTTGAPNQASTTFSAEAGDGILCVENGANGNRATTGWIELNGQREIGPSSFQKSVASIERQVRLEASNTLEARIAGAPGTAYAVKVYGADPSCTAGENDGEEHAEDERESDQDELALTVDARTVVQRGERSLGQEESRPALKLELGARAVIVDRGTHDIPPDVEQGAELLEAQQHSAMGCSSTGSAISFAAVLAVLALIGLGGRRCTVPVRTRRRR